MSPIKDTTDLTNAITAMRESQIRLEEQFNNFIKNTTDKREWCTKTMERIESEQKEFDCRLRHNERKTHYLFGLATVVGAAIGAWFKR